MKRLALMMIGLIFCALQINAQETRSSDYLIYMQGGEVYAQALYGSDRMNLGAPLNNVETAIRIASPVLREIFDYLPATMTPPDDDYGFYHGVMMPDGGGMIALEMQSAGMGYRVVRYTGGIRFPLFSGENSVSRGYLDPIAIAEDGTIILLERQMRYRLDTVNVWRFNEEADSEPTRFASFEIGTLYGRTAILPDGSGVVLGVNPESRSGYTLNFELGRVFAFAFNSDTPEPPRSAFELYPVSVHVLGVFPLDALNSLRGQLNTPMPNPGAPQRPAPFLHWPLSDDERRITCYTDSNWTHANFQYVCAGMASPRDYDGHQGTDVSGILGQGLLPGTPVYPSVQGVVVRTYGGCVGGLDVSCGGAYGNIVMLEHTITVNGESQLWFTGYAHLTEPLVNVGDYITDLTQSIALSGETGVGGPHLHFEVRNWYINANNRWVDPWGAYYPPHGESLWIDGNEHPLALVSGD
ncbi:MAG: M23 family metallopeptidase [Aggregatilineales bacterium]